MTFPFHHGIAAILVACLGLKGADFKSPPDTEKSPSRPLAPYEAAAGWRLPPGFSVSVVAAEPDVRQPIALSFDPRGRLWVAENFTYAEPPVLFSTNLDDRVLILEDADHDGRAESRKVFLDGLKLLTSVETGLGGVWLLCPPRLLFVPDRDGDDVPDGPPETILDGFDTTTGSHHTLANGLRWGPDGWLWGRVGISSPTRVGRPGDPESARVNMGGGIWRYHPRTRRVESVAHGTTNPWGDDWNAEGEPFFINTVIGHLWHAIPGAHYRRMYGEDPTPFVYSPIEQHADHFHFDTGAGWTCSRAGQQDGTVASGSDSLGGGHAHTGLMIYQGGNWPAEYEGALFTLNLHGRRINRERLERKGSGYVGRHSPDFGFSPDPWFRPTDIIQGPDGAAYIADWSDTGECHEHDGVHRSSGRIYRLAFTNSPASGAAFGRNPSLEDLLESQSGSSEWRRRMGRALLRDKAAASGLGETVLPALQEKLAVDPSRLGRLRTLWALVAIEGTSPELLRRLLRDPDEHVRSWAVRLLADEFPAPGNPTVGELTALSQTDRSALVRLYIASALRKLPHGNRIPILKALSLRPEDDADSNLGRMLWFALEPLTETHPEEALEIAAGSRIHLLRHNLARRMTEDLSRFSTQVGRLLLKATDRPSTEQLDVLEALAIGLRGARRVAPPGTWPAASARFATSQDARVRELAVELGSVFGDGRAIDALMATARNKQADPVARRSALAAVMEARPEGLGALLQELVEERELWTEALSGLIRIDSPSAPSLIGGKLRWMQPPDRARVIAAAAARVATARAVVEAVADRRIAATDLSPAVARQMVGLGDETLARRLAETWGTVGATDPDLRKSIERFRGELSAAGGTEDRVAGRRLFQRVCSACHKLYGEGGELGPDLTGSGRSDLGYLLENVVAPNTVVAADYRMTVVQTKDGRILNGLLRSPSPGSIILMTSSGVLTLDRSDVEKIETQSVSMMPEGLLDGLSPEERRDLVAYLRHPTQVGLPAKD
jgi:putative membrane-bound dehydrogenase-like protein